MDADSQYLFDVNGYIVLRDVLGASELSRLNRAIDAHHHEIQTIGRD